jgi:hypothetical protein
MRQRKRGGGAGLPNNTQLMHHFKKFIWTYEPLSNHIARPSRIGTPVVETIRNNTQIKTKFKVDNNKIKK